MQEILTSHRIHRAQEVQGVQKVPKAPDAKRLIVICGLVAALLASLALVGCGNSMNGTYVSEKDQSASLVIIDGEKFEFNYKKETYSGKMMKLNETYALSSTDANGKGIQLVVIFDGNTASVSGIVWSGGITLENERFVK